MAKDCEIVLLRESFALSEVSDKTNRDRLLSTVSELDSNKISEQDLRKYFNGIQLALGAFAKKIVTLEYDILELKKDQLASEARTEAMYLKAQLEIQQLRSEISEIKLSKSRISQIVQVAKVLQGNAYAPYAVKSLVDGVMGQNSSSTTSTNNFTTKLPIDFMSRLKFAQQNGFKWNQNNRRPNKPAKQLQILEEWEDQFCLVETMGIEQILNKRHITSVGSGAIAGALMYLERELGALLPERNTLSVFNCYQRAVKIYNEQSNITAQTPCVFDVKMLVRDGFKHLTDTDTLELENRLKSRDLGSIQQMVSGVKKIVSKTILPSFVTYDDSTISDTQKLYDLQGGKYDYQIESFCAKYLLTS
jgi:hypothetical protein